MDNLKAIECLKDLIRINTIGGDEKQAADHLEKLLSSYGITTRQVVYSRDRNQLIATLKGAVSGKVLAFSGHMDVVPVGEKKWKYDALGAEESDGKIYGRGASDMKSGVMAAVVALVRLKENNLPYAGEVRLLLTVGEETGAIGAGQLTELGYADDLDALIIGEPSKNNICFAHKGAFWLRVHTYGHTAHGSMPDLGVNAIDHMILFINAFNKAFHFASYTDELLGRSTSSLNVINGGVGTNVVPDKCSIEIDIRTLPGQDHDRLLKQVNELIDRLSKDKPGFKADVEIINNQMPVYTEPDDPLVGISKKAIEAVTGKKPDLLATSGYTDASQFVKSEKKFPVLIIGPGIGEQAHQPDEYVWVQDYLDSIAIYEGISKEFLKNID